MPWVGSLLKLALKVGPQATELVRWAWPRIRDNEATQQQLGRLLQRLARATGRGPHRMSSQIGVLREEAQVAAKAARTDAEAQRAQGWQERLDRLESGVRMLSATAGPARLRHARALRRELARIRQDMIAATMGVPAAEVPAALADPEAQETSGAEQP